MGTGATSSETMIGDTLAGMITRFKSGLAPAQITTFHAIEAMLIKQVIDEVLNDK